MMKKYLILMIGVILFSTSCEKEDLRKEYVKWIDPDTEPDRLCRALGVEGDNIDGVFPSPMNPAIIGIDNSQSSALASANTELFVPFLYSGSGKLSGVYLQVAGAENYWDIPVSVAEGSSSFTFPVGIPERVLQGNFQMIFAIYDDQGNVSYARSMGVGVAPVQSACSGGNLFTMSGSAGLTVQRIELGNTPGQVSISHQMYTLPDRLDILYGGEWVASTAPTPLPSNGTPPPSVCFDGTEGYIPGTGTLTFDYDPAISREFHIYMYGCFGATAWDLWVSCPDEQICTSLPEGVGPSWQHKEITYEANLGVKVSSGVWVNERDYVFFGARNKVVLESGTSILHGAPTQVMTSSDGTTLGNESLRKYSQFRYGQMLLNLGGQLYGCEEYTLNDFCEGVALDDFIADNVALVSEYGGYFIAPKSGFIEFEINDSKPSDNKFSYKIDLYVLTEDQHRCRNFFNKCPKTVPQKIGGEYRDVPKNYLWTEEGFISDDDIEQCYHGEGNIDFRGVSIDIKGCQCVYGPNGNLVNENDPANQGTFDYGYWFDPPNAWPLDASSLRIHFILDVFPHIAYGRGYQYSPTPEENIY